MAMGATGALIIATTFSATVVTYQAGEMNKEELASIWVTPGATLTPFFHTAASTAPVGYVLDQGDKRVVCRLVDEGKFYNCETNLRR